LVLFEEQKADLCSASAGELVRRYARQSLSPVEVTKAALERAQATQEAFNAFTVIDRDGALSAARASETRWKMGEPASPIDGVPITIKDVVYCRGLDIRFGSKTTPNTASLPDAPSVERLRNAGATIIGVTTTPEFGWKPVTDNPKDGITRNPWDSAMTPGGSSGGAAVAAATGAGVLHLGSDGGGSIRIPASFTGVVGFKPSFGRVPVHPASSFGTLAHIGPLTRTVDDAVLMLNAMAGRDIRDWTQAPMSFGGIDVKSVNWSGKRIAYWKTPFTGTADREVIGAVVSVLEDISLAGGAVIETLLPDHDALFEMFLRHWYVAAATKLASIDIQDHQLIDPGFVKAAQIGGRYNAVDLMQSEIQRVRFGAQMDGLFEEFDYIFAPTVAIPPFEAELHVPRNSGMTDWTEWLSFTFPANLSQQPACSVPCGFTASGLPIGLQIIGPRGADGSVLSAALTIQQMYPDRFIGLGGKWPDKS
jgi:aspartyl-tRNA(Asn)/glutamyl-tRNA(Gln) amidotransferase subunit A